MRRLTILTLLFTSLLLAPFATASAPVREPIPDQESACQPFLTHDPTATVGITNVSEGNATAHFDLSGVSTDFGAFIHLPPRTSIREYDGFGRGAGGSAYWNSSMPSNPHLQYEWKTSKPEVTDPLTFNVSYISGPTWHLVPIPYSTEVHLQTRISNGSTAGSYAFVGPHTTNEIRLNSCETLSMVTGPGINDSRAQLEDSVQSTSQYIRFGVRHERLNAIVYPNSTGIYGGVAIDDKRGTATFLFENPKQGMRPFQTGVIAAHEYVHTRQIEWQLGSDVAWLREAVANYYAVESLYEAGEFSAIQRKAFYHNWGALSSKSILANRSTWTGDTPYERGLHVLKELDSRIRDKTGGNSSLQTVFQNFEPHQTVTWGSFNRSVVDLAGESTGNWLQKAVYTSRVPQSASEAGLRYSVKWLYWNLSAGFSEIHWMLAVLFWGILGGALSIPLDLRIIPLVLRNEPKEYDLNIGLKLFRVAVLFESAYFWLREKLSSDS